MTQHTYIANLQDIMPEVMNDSIISRVLLKNEAANVTLFGFDAGQELTEHTASRPAILHFIEGKAEITLGEDCQVATAGTWIYMPARMPHSIRTLEPTRMLLILVHGD